MIIEKDARKIRKRVLLHAAVGGDSSVTERHIRRRRVVAGKNRGCILEDH